MDTDEQFLNDFKTAVIPFEQWTHAAHIRMAYLICKSSSDFEQALSTIRQGIQKFNGLHASKLKVGFHETMTRLWTILVWNEVQKCDSVVCNSHDFMQRNPHLLDSSLWKQYYTPELMFAADSKLDFVAPDLKSVSIDQTK